jgi:hypothetical protein
MLLVERRRQLVPRGEIAERLWGKGVFHDVDQGVNTAIRKIRLALRDSPEASGYIETVPGRVPLPRQSKQSKRRHHRRRHSIGRAAVRDSRLAWTGIPRRRLAKRRSPRSDKSPPSICGSSAASTMVYRKTEKSLAAIGAELQVDYVVEGSVRHEGDRLRVTASLVRVRDQAQVWTSSYDREVHNMLGVQEELSAAIAEQVTRRLSPDRVSALSRRQTRNAEAYDLYLRGRRFWKPAHAGDNRLAVDCFSAPRSWIQTMRWPGPASLKPTSSPMNGDAPPDDAAARRAIPSRRPRDPDLAEASMCWVSSTS